MTRSHSLKIHLLLFGLVCFVPGMVTAAYFGWQVSNKEKQRVEDRASNMVRSLQSTVELQLASSVSVLDTLSETTSFRAKDFTSFRAVADAVAKKSNAALTVRTVSGEHVFNTLIPNGGTMPTTIDPVLMAADREAVATRRPVVSNVYIGATAGTPFVAIIVPTLDQQGRVEYLLTMAVNLARFNNLIELGELSDRGWSATIAGADDRVLARSRELERFVTAPLTARLRDAIRSQPFGSIFSTTLDGIDVFTTYATSAQYGWRFIVSAPVAEIHQPLRTVIWAMILLTLAAIAMTVSFAWLLGRRLGAEIMNLCRNSEALGKGGELQPFPTSVTEIGAAQSSLFEANDRIEHLLKELAHRVKNTLSIIKAISGRTVRRPEVRQSLSGRIDALSRSHEALSDTNWTGVDLNSLVSSVARGNDAAVSTDGPPIQLSPKATVAAAQILHELVTNAKQHGALSRHGGRVSFNWYCEDLWLKGVWKETSPSFDPDSEHQNGFGLQMLDLCIGRQLDGEWELDKEATGWTIRFAIPFASHLGQNVL